MNLKNEDVFISKNAYDILIFVQAPADLRHALSICEKNESKQILMCVVNVQPIYKFVKELSIQNVEVVFIDYIRFSYKKIGQIIKAKTQFNALLKRIKELSFQEVYFFSRNEDWLTCGVIGRLSKEKRNIEIFYYNHYDDLGLKKANKKSFSFLKNSFIVKVCTFLTGILFVSRDLFKTPEFAFWKYPIKEINQSKERVTVGEKYLYKIPKKDKTTVIFFISQEDVDFITEKSSNKLKDFLSKAQLSDWFICLKGHPRIGDPEAIKPFFHFAIPNYVPSEFLDYTKVDIVLGMGSAAIVYPLNIDVSTKVISIVKDLEFKNTAPKDLYIRYLDELTSNKVQYVSLAELEDMLKEN